MLTNNRRNTITLDKVRLIFKNFSGRASEYNAAGNRNFAIVLDEETAHELYEDYGLNVKYPKPGDERDLDPYLKVIVRFENFPPRIILLTGKGQTVLNEDTVFMLDFADIEWADITLSLGRPGRWTRSDGREGVPTYVKTMYIKLHEDPLEERYSHYSESDDSAMNATCDGCRNLNGTCEDCQGRDRDLPF